MGKPVPALALNTENLKADEKIAADPRERDDVLKTFSVGICAAQDGNDLNGLLEMLRSETFSPNYLLKQIVVVASGCTEASLSPLRNLAEMDSRVMLIEESERHGKAEAINRIAEKVEEEFLVLVNADSLPTRGSIEKMLDVLLKERNVAIVSARPFFHVERGITEDVLSFMWATHNAFSFDLNHRGLSNHSSDELMAIRSRSFSFLPFGIVNDGAYLAGKAFRQGHAIRLCAEAAVRIDVPSRFIDLVRQRRRIVFGHFQVWKILGQVPRTVESLLLSSPIMSLRIVVRILADNPRLVRIVPVALVGEFAALATAVWDAITSAKRHTVWKRYGG